MPTGDPRAHHFIPRCWLAGFTETGEKDGQLWVTDLSRAKQWQTNPGGAGHQRDLYRLSENLDPIMAETALSKVESAVAPILKRIDVERLHPLEEELEPLLYFVALQWARVPSFRPWILGITDKFTRKEFCEALKSKETWESALKKAGMSIEDPGADYASMLKLEQSGSYSLSAGTDWYMLRAFEAADKVFPLLLKRHWTVAISPSGSFIGSDNPVSMDGPPGTMVGFRNAEIITFPISRHVLLTGTNVLTRPPFVNRRMIGNANTWALLRADAQVYSHRPDFCWHDEENIEQTDWTRFSKDKFSSLRHERITIAPKPKS